MNLYKYSITNALKKKRKITNKKNENYLIREKSLIIAFMSKKAFSKA